jgi:hypothetical protein
MEYTIYAARPTATTLHTATKPARAVSRALISSGGLWIAYYAMWIASGLLTGDTPLTLGTAGYVVTNALFVTALLGLNAGLAGLALWLRRRAPILGSIGLVIALFGVVSVTYGCVARVVAGLTIGAPGGFSVLASCFGATVLGMAAWRAQALPRHISGLLLFIGLLTFPLIIALGMIANLWLPAWATDELPFALSGALWVTFGALMQRN